MVAFTGLEILVAFLQAYVFAVLTCIYLNDALTCITDTSYIAERRS
jgi:F0F1-type ATP synthase membrane subunit a